VAEHRFVLLALDEPGGAPEQLGIADVVEMSVRQQNRPDIRRRDADVGELATDGSDDDPPDIVGNDPAAGFLGDLIVDAGVSDDPFARATDQIGVAGQADLLAHPSSRRVDGTVRRHRDPAVQDVEPVDRSGMFSTCNHHCSCWRDPFAG
jgi:hypothetical protein